MLLLNLNHEIFQLPLHSKLTGRLFIFSAVIALRALAEYSQSDIDSGTALLELNQRAIEVARERLESSDSTTCTTDTVRLRREWRVPRLKIIEGSSNFL